MIASPMRYPGGKAKLQKFFSNLIAQNSMWSHSYCEPYAGGAGLAIKLLTTGFTNHVILNDIDPAIYALWDAILTRTDDFCELIDKTPLTVDEWRNQNEIYKCCDGTNGLKLGFATYYLNRTNRSGIISGAGPIGGYEQSGRWKLDARTNKVKQINNIQLLSKFSDQIEFVSMDALEFLADMAVTNNTMSYLDPPYYVKGSRLYRNFYNHDDHLLISELMRTKRDASWIVSYDNVDEVKKMYAGFRAITYALSYSAGKKATGQEIMFFSDAILPPDLSEFDAMDFRSVSEASSVLA